MSKVATYIAIIFITFFCSSCSNEQKIFAECGMVVAKYNAINYISRYATDLDGAANTFYVVMLTIPYCDMKTVEVSNIVMERLE